MNITSQRTKKIKNKRIILAIIGGIMGVVIFLTGSFAVTVAGEINGGLRKGDSIVTVDVPQGSSGAAIANILEESGAIKNATLFRIYCKLQNKGANFNYGKFQIVKGSSYNEITEILSGQVAFAETVTVTIPEGTGVYDYVKYINGKDVVVPGIATLLSNAGVCTQEDFFEALSEVSLNSKLLGSVNKKEAYVLLEGYLFPDTYNFYFYTASSYSYSSKTCAELAIGRMLAKTEEVFTNEMYARAEQMGYSVNEILTMASIVQLEAGIREEQMAKVAAVFYNRLKNPAGYPNLGSSATVYYGSFNKNDDDRYCTQYIYNSKGEVVKSAIEGLPPGPICSPGIAAIKAALYPEENFNKTFFVTDSDGVFYFTATAAEHQKVINALRNGDKWIYEGYK